MDELVLASVLIVVRGVLSVLLSRSGTGKVRCLFECEGRISFLGAVCAGFGCFPVSSTLGFPVIVNGGASVGLKSVGFGYPVGPSLIQLKARPVPMVRSKFSELIIGGDKAVRVNNLFVYRAKMGVLVERNTIFSMTSGIGFNRLDGIMYRGGVSVKGSFEVS